MLERGDKVIAVSRSLDKLSDFPKLPNLRLQQLDITDGAAVVKRKVDEAVSWFGWIDVLVNNAGLIDTIGPGEELGFVSPSAPTPSEI